ncbi:MAG: hypothetical protein FJ309_08915 [Planctomycetes bacterium]|nr:hypothetical protein [Planctomycetota bacterium]MBM4056972.1 hypothetical protein [Planctomycetota bacterium]
MPQNVHAPDGSATALGNLAFTVVISIDGLVGQPRRALTRTEAKPFIGSNAVDIGASRTAFCGSHVRRQSR